jgi:transposase
MLKAGIHQQSQQCLSVINIRSERPSEDGQCQGLGGLWEAPGRGAKPKCQAEDLQYVAELLAQETRTYNSTQLVRKLKQERNIDLSSDRLRRLLKKTLSMETHPHQSPEKTKSSPKSN